MRLRILPALLILTLAGCNQAVADNEAQGVDAAQTIARLEARISALEKENDEMRADAKRLSAFVLKISDAVSTIGKGTEYLLKSDAETINMLRDITADEAAIARQQAGRPAQ